MKTRTLTIFILFFLVFPYLSANAGIFDFITGVAQKINPLLVPQLQSQYPEVDLQKVQIKKGSTIGRIFAFLNQGAVTFGNTIHYAKLEPDQATPEGQAVLVHELVHVQQYGKMGFVPFLARYALGYLTTGPKYWIRGKAMPIDEHPLEKPAYEAGRKFLEQY